MDQNPGLRKTPVHFDGFGTLGRPTIQFITICVQDRKPILATEAVHKLLIEAWRLAGAWLVGRYILMPDHIHLFASPASFDQVSLKKWMAYWRSHASRHWPVQDEHPIWQREYWDRALRHGQSYSEKWAYVRENPVRMGLVAHADDWPYQGELNDLPWLD